MKQLLHYFQHHFHLVLILVVLVSFGQMLWMNTWQDDQALFFKLAHIDQAPGFFGPGPFGSGAYKYAATPFIPIYHFFGFNTYAYFAFLITLYMITTLVIYKVFTFVLGESGGKIAGFIYASGYITSDGFWRMANSATTSISIILISLFLYCYWKLRSSNNKLILSCWYLAALFTYWVASELAITRVHYFFGVVVAFELLFLTFRQLPVSIAYSVIRLMPFALVVYNTLIANADQRTSGVKFFFLAIFEGRLDYYYGYISSLANLVFPDWLTNAIFLLQGKYYPILGPRVPMNTLILLLFGIAIYLVFIKHKFKVVLTITFLVLEVAWYKLANQYFNTPLLNLGQQQIFVLFIGGMFLLISLAVLIVIKGVHRKIYLLLILWILGNTAAYSAYFPTIAYETTNRYLAHSFVALAGLYGLIFVSLPKQRLLGRIGAGFIILIGVINIIQIALLENQILKNRSIPTKAFFTQLKSSLPHIQNGDILYIDVADNAAGLYQDVVSAAMMPDTTAFAWRYGIDRYDFRLTNDFNELKQIVKDNQSSRQQIHSFWYDGVKLINTSDQVRNFLTANQDLVGYTQSLHLSYDTQVEQSDKKTIYTTPNPEIILSQPISSAVPAQVNINITALPISGSKILFPLSTNLESVDKDQYLYDLDHTTLLFDYQKFKSEFYQAARFELSSEWRERLAKNINDQDETTVWQSDRILWADKTAVVTIALPEVEQINKLVWKNGFPNNTPTSYYLESSLDKITWKKIKQVHNPARIENTIPQVIDFPTENLRYIRMTITDTVGGDSPSIAEIWVVPAAYNNLDINQAESYLKNPLQYVPDLATFNLVMNNLHEIITAHLSWQSNKSKALQTNKGGEVRLIYDGVPHNYLFHIPAGGTKISKLVFTDLIVPGNIVINNIEVNYKLGSD